jgi:hypothetical protein
MEIEENKEFFGSLFGTIDLLNEDHLEVILSTMDKDNSLYYLIESIKAAHKRGAFTIGEIEVISKAIRTVSRQ